MSRDSIRIVEVGPRDGLQNERTGVPLEVRIQFIRDLARAGLTEIELGSFVSPKAVPAMADSEAVFTQTADLTRVRRWGLVPNPRGQERAERAGVDAYAFFTAASPDFLRENLRTDLETQITELREMVQSLRATRPEVPIAAYISTVVACPFRGAVAPGTVVALANRLHMEVGIEELSLGDTIGVASPRDVDQLARAMADDYAGPLSQVRWHFHDTRGTAIANVARVMEWGSFAGFDASAAGLGGCPFAPGATGNLATEDLVYFLEREGVSTGVNLGWLAQASLPVLMALGRRPTAKAQVAELAMRAGSGDTRKP